MIRLKTILIESSLAFDNEFKELVKQWEGPGPVDKAGNHLAYDDANPKVPAKPGIRPRGTLTIGYGTTASVLPTLKPGMKISHDKADALLTKGIAEHEHKAMQLVPKFNTYPKYVRAAILNAIYRGDLGPNTRKLINQGKWKEASIEYLKHPNYTNPGKFVGVVKRMKSNSVAFDKYASELKSKQTQIKPKPFKTGVDWMDKALSGDTYIYVVKPGDTLLAIANKHGLSLDVLKGMNGLTNGNIVPGQKLKLK